MIIKKIDEYIFEVDTYKELDYDVVLQDFAARMNKWKPGNGGCSCIAKTTDAGETIVGRNMDLTISDKPAYIIRTDCEGKHKTVGISYSHMSGPSYQEVLNNGISDEHYKMLPFLCCDIMNDNGFYVEINMRSGEYYADGSSKFACSGTKQGAKYRICSVNLPRFLAENCADVDEAVRFAKEELDMYTPNIPGFDWNFCFILADKSGKYGLLEIADNKVSWLEGERAQVNYYKTPEFARVEDLKCGLGRHELLVSNIDSVQNDNDMLNLMKRVSYSCVYKNNPEYNVFSEYVGVEPNWTIDYINDENNKQEIQNRIDRNINEFSKLSRKELEDGVKYWESIFTVAANCNNRILKVRFFEDENRIMDVLL